MSPPHLGSTYRLQLQGLGFRQAAALVPYLADLGIETLYLSPIWAAAPGSAHGYDVVDPSRLDSSLGDAAEFEELMAALLSRGMRALLDVVPNHMATDRANSCWWSVLRHGRASADADVFDIDWDDYDGRILVPTLDRPLADVLAEDAVGLDAPKREVHVAGQTFPAADGTPAGPAQAILGAQHYRPAFWRLGPAEGNYRRFFDIGSLIGVRVEDPAVFERTHALVRALVRHRGIAGVRVDHVDGLADPTRYLRRLRDHLEGPGEDTAAGTTAEDVVILVEKILGPDETLDERWPVDGTTGYEFADRALGLFVDPAGSARLLVLGSDLTGSLDPAFAVESVRARREALERSFSGDVDRLARMSRAVLDEHEPGHDLAVRDLRRAWGDLTVHLDVYRTYFDGEGTISAADLDRVQRSSRAARAAASSAGHGGESDRARRLLARRLSTEVHAGSPWLEVARRWQQLSGAVMAKGVEDTATYRYVGLSASADVGGDPDHTPSPDAFHRFVARRTQGLNATSTHDSKRNEDARCRLAVLSEADGEWATLVRRWHDRYGDGGLGTAPQPLDELRVYETLVALWSSDDDVRKRTRDYVRKAAREAKLFTSWTDPDDGYEKKLTSFVDSLYADSAFREELTHFSDSIAGSALSNSLALVVLKTCCPGVPDFYQGTEYTAPVLTDPDNRRPLDFEARAVSLAELPEASERAAAKLLGAEPDSPVKLYVTRLLLRERRSHPDLFDRGTYRSLAVTSAHALAFARELEGQRLVAVVARLTHGMTAAGAAPLGSEVWRGATVDLADGRSRRFRDVLTNRVLAAPSGRLDLGEVLGVLPVALLRPDPDETD